MPGKGEEKARIKVGDSRVVHDLANKEGRPHRPGPWVDMWLLWVVKYLVKGYRKPLDENELPLNCKVDETSFLGEQARKYWAEEVAKKGPAKASLVRGVMLRIQAFEVYLGVILSAVQGILFSVGRPLLLGSIIDVVADPNSTDGEGYALAGVFAAVILLEGTIQAMVKQLLSCRMGVRFFTWMSSLLHDKVTTVSASAVAESGLQESTLLGSDVTRMVEEWRWLCLFPYVIVALIGGVTVLAVTLGTASLVGLGLMLLVVLINLKLSSLTQKIEEKDFAVGDERVSTLREVLDGIKAIKMMAWEVPFSELLFSSRKKEANYVRQFRSLQVTSVNIGRASPILASCFSILALALTDPANLTARTIFVSITAFQGLRLPLIALNQHVVLIGNSIISFRRLSRFLNLDNAQPIAKLDNNGPIAASMDKASFRWSKEKNSDTGFKLSDLSFEVKRDNHLVAVVGRVGNGKSTLVSSLLGITHAETGKASTVDNLAIVPQKAFVMSGTITDNVCMGHAYDQELFDRVLRASALDVDIKVLPNGFETEIGERGQTLSGGQAARLSLARALYHQPDLLILDDPLSAVDPEVANNLFRRSVMGFLGRFGTLYPSDEANTEGKPRRSVIMTLNQLHLLRHFDHVIVLQDGKIAEQGGYEELLAQNGMLTAMIDGLEAVEDDDIETLLEKDQNENIAAVQLEEEQAENAIEKEANQVVLVQNELGQKGSVSSKVLWEYVKAMGVWRLPFSLLAGFTAYAMMSAADIYLASWIEVSQTLTDDQHIDRATVYIILGVANVIGIQVLSLLNARGSYVASRAVHDVCIDHLMHAPISFFQATPSGRVVARFSGDLSVVDRMLAFLFDDVFQFGFLLMALCFTVIYIVPILAVVLVIGLGVFSWQVVAVDRTSREVKRYSNQSLAPILTNVSESVNARELMHSMKLEDYFRLRHVMHTNRYSSNQFMSLTVVNFSTLFAGLISFFLCTCAALVVVSRRETYEPAQVGLALTYSFLVPYFLGILAMIFPMGFAALTSLERILEYRGDDVPQEGEWELPSDLKLLQGDAASSTAKEGSELTSITPGIVSPKVKKADDPAIWPSKGRVEFLDVSLRYRPELPLSLEQVTFSIKGGTSHALVGRSGSGKSSLTLCLFRVEEICGGKILIDGQDIAKVGLQTLRSSLTIIPQTPLLLKGSLRKNLDPFNIHTDDELRTSLIKVGLDPELLLNEAPVDAKAESEGKNKKKNKKKNKEQSSTDKPEAGTPKEEDNPEEATNLSVGERQLLSLARATLRPPHARRIVVLDEPTSSLDQESDNHIQNVVRNEFGTATTITIAHRISSIIDSDTITVMDHGKVGEHGTPAQLLANEGGLFHSMVHAMGKTTAAHLTGLANKSALGRGQALTAPDAPATSAQTV